MPLSRADAEGMTTNERLFVSGLLGKFEDAVSRGDKAAVREILQTIFIDETSILMILQSIEK